MAELLRIVVTGRVQGVGYRFFVERTAQALQVSGWVRNLPNGSVEVLACLEPRNKARFLAHLREGPAHAAVTGLDVQPADPAEAPAPGGFHIRG